MAYRPGDYPPFAVTADLVVLTIRAGVFSVLLVRRGAEPHARKLALPGGFAHVDEDLQDAAYRELGEECSIGRENVVLEQLRTYGRPGRDPRMRVVSIAWLALGAQLPEPAAGTDAAAAGWWPVQEALTTDLAFDHGDILGDGVERARSKLEYSPLATAFCRDRFTVAELRQVYETVWGTGLDPSNFHRKVTRAKGFLLDTGQRQARSDLGRPARLYAPGPALRLHPPILRPGR